MTRTFFLFFLLFLMSLTQHSEDEDEDDPRSPVHLVALPHSVRYFLAFMVRMRALLERGR